MLRTFFPFSYLRTMMSLLFHYRAISGSRVGDNPTRDPAMGSSRGGTRHAAWQIVICICCRVGSTGCATSAPGGSSPQVRLRLRAVAIGL